MKILLLPGDGVGREVTEQAKLVLHSASDAAIEFSEMPIGGAAIEEFGGPLPQQTVDALDGVDAVLLGAVGAPQYDSLRGDQKPEKGLLALRRRMNVFANLRPAVCYPALSAASPLKEDLADGMDILIVRELIGGIYFGEPRGAQTIAGKRAAKNTMRYDEDEIRRIAKMAFAAAAGRGGRLCSVDKANVLEVSVLWREVIAEVGAQYPQVELSHMYVDNAAMQLVRRPKQFDVIVTGNLFGDILSDIAAMLTGSIGMLPSASLNETRVGLYEPAHGAAPDIAGRDLANPIAAVLSAAMMCRHSLQSPQTAARIERAVQKTLASGARTFDIAAPGGDSIGCAEMGRRIRDNLEA